MGKKEESKLTAKILKALRDKGAFAYKTHGGWFQQSGLPDVIGCYMGVFFGIEVKTPEDTAGVTPLQLDTLRDIHEAGGKAAIARSVEEAVSVLEQIFFKGGRQ